jgi:hypothetical protein
VRATDDCSPRFTGSVKWFEQQRTELTSSFAQGSTTPSPDVFDGRGKVDGQAPTVRLAG